MPTTKQTPMPGMTFTLETGTYLLSDMGAQRLIRALREIEDTNPDALLVVAMLKDNLAGELPTDVRLGDQEREAVLRALEETMGTEPLLDELFALRDGLLREPD